MLNVDCHKTELSCPIQHSTAMPSGSNAATDQESNASTPPPEPAEVHKEAEFRVHRVNFFHYMPNAIHNLAYDEEAEKLALSRYVDVFSLRISMP